MQGGGHPRHARAAVVCSAQHRTAAVMAAPQRPPHPLPLPHTAYPKPLTAIASSLKAARRWRRAHDERHQAIAQWIPASGPLRRLSCAAPARSCTGRYGGREGGRDGARDKDKDDMRRDRWPSIRKDMRGGKGSEVKVAHIYHRSARMPLLTSDMRQRARSPLCAHD